MSQNVDYLIHCGSSVTVSPGVTMTLRENLSRFDAGPTSSISISSSESDSGDVCLSRLSKGAWACGARGRMVKVIALDADIAQANKKAAWCPTEVVGQLIGSSYPFCVGEHALVSF